MAQGANGRMIGLVELSIRPYAEGCDSHRVAYLEGWYVVPEFRRKGVGRALIKSAQEWERSFGCIELASDTHPDNVAGYSAHTALGFTDVGVVR